MSRAPYSRRKSSPHANSCRPGHRSTWARPAEHDAIIKLQHLHELQMLTAYTSHMDTRVSMEHVRAGARARACVACDMQQDAERRSPPRDAEHEARRSIRETTKVQDQKLWRQV